MRYGYGAHSLGCECQEVILLVTLGLSNSKSESRVTLYFFRAVVQRVLKVEVFEVGSGREGLDKITAALITSCESYSTGMFITTVS